MSNEIEDVVNKLESCLKKAVLMPLSKYPSKIKSDKEIEDLSSAAGKFIAKHFEGEKNGNYFAFYKPDILDEKGNFLTKEELLEKFKEVLLIHQYSGEGNLLDRIGKMRAGIRTDRPNPVVFFMHDNEISTDDIYVLAVATGGTKKERQSTVEAPCHNYCEEKTGKRFVLADYSASNGENGTKQMSLETQIMSFANLKFEDGWKAFENLEEIKRRSLGVFLSNTAGQMKTTTIQTQTASIV